MTDYDPFASAPVAPVSVGDSVRDRIVVTIKAGGPSDPWAVFHGDSIAEVQDLIGAAEATGLFAEIAKASDSLKGFFNAGQVLGASPTQAPSVAQGSYQAQPQQQYQAAPQAAQGPPPGVVAPMCPHGQRNYVAAGVSKSSGKQYGAFWGCPAQQGDPSKCRPEWVK